MALYYDIPHQPRSARQRRADLFKKVACTVTSVALLGNLCLSGLPSRAESEAEGTVPAPVEEIAPTAPAAENSVGADSGMLAVASALQAQAASAPAEDMDAGSAATPPEGSGTPTEALPEGSVPGSEQLSTEALAEGGTPGSGQLSTEALDEHANEPSALMAAPLPANATPEGEPTGALPSDEERENLDPTAEQYQGYVFDLAKYVNNVDVFITQGGEQQETQHLKPGDKIQVAISFDYKPDETGQLFQNNQFIALYQLPAELTPDLGTADFLSGPVYPQGDSSVTPMGYYRIYPDDPTDDYPGGRIYIVYTNETMQATSSMSGSITLTGSVNQIEDGGKSELVFPGSGGTSITIAVFTPDVSIKKGQPTVTQDGHYQYTLTVTTTNGTVDPITVKDHLTGGIFNETSVTITKRTPIEGGGSTETPINNASPVITNPESGKATMEWVNNDSGDNRLPPLNAGESYTITYTVTPKAAAADGAQSLKNEFSANDQWNNPSVDTDISKVVVHKQAGAFNHVENTITWTITLKPGPGGSLAGYTVTDSSWGSDNPVLPDGKLSLQPQGGGDPITVTVQPDGSFTIPDTVPAGQTYTFTYSTTHTPAQAETSVENTVTITKDGENYSDTATGKIPSSDWAVNKSSQNPSNDPQKWGEGDAARDVVPTKWTSTITLKAHTSFAKLGVFTYTDTLLPNQADTTPNASIHFTTVQTLAQSLADKPPQLNLYQQDGRTQEVNLTDYADLTLTCYGPDETTQIGEAIALPATGTDLDNTSKVVKFDLTVTPKDTAANIKAQSVKFVYDTLLDVTGQAPGGYNYYNRGTVEKASHTASVWFNKPNGTPKKYSAPGVLLTRPDLSTGPEYNISSKYPDWGKLSEQPTTLLWYPGDELPYISYAVYLPYPALDGEKIILTDTLPAGTAYVQDSGFGLFANNWGTPSYIIDPIQQNPGSTPAYDTSQIQFSCEGQTLTITIPKGYLNNWPASNGTDGGLLLVYAVQVTQDLNQQQAGTAAVFSNQVVWNGNAATAETKIEKATVNKSGQLENDRLEYTVILNPTGENLDPTSDTLTLVDTLTEQNQYLQNSISLDLDSVKLYRYDTSQPNNQGAEIDPSKYAVHYNYDTPNQRILTLQRHAERKRRYRARCQPQQGRSYLLQQPQRHWHRQNAGRHRAGADLQNGGQQDG